jgi:superfamily I DNA/RNA helicase
MFDITTDRESLISIHSAKGLDFDLVNLMGVDRIQPKDDTRNYLTHLLYVAVTKAKHRLVIPYKDESEFISKMKAGLR